MVRLIGPGWIITQFKRLDGSIQCVDITAVEILHGPIQDRVVVLVLRVLDNIHVLDPKRLQVFASRMVKVSSIIPKLTQEPEKRVFNVKLMVPVGVAMLVPADIAKEDTFEWLARTPERSEEHMVPDQRFKRGVPGAGDLKTDGDVTVGKKWQQIE